MSSNGRGVSTNLHPEIEASLSKQINNELTASYIYLSMFLYFSRRDVSLTGFIRFFKHQSVDEREHAEKLMSYVNERGGVVELQEIHKPGKQKWTSGLEALEEALALEHKVNQSLIDLNSLALTHNDTHLVSYLEEEFLTEQVRSIKEIGDMITDLKRLNARDLDR